MSKKNQDKYAEHEDAPLAEHAPLAEGDLTPAQTAELGEQAKPWLERFKAAVDDVAARHQQGTAPAPALVAELRALYAEMDPNAAEPTEPEPKAIA
jgi:hypothetical protein